MNWEEFFNNQVYAYQARLTSKPEYKLYVGFNITNEAYAIHKAEITKYAAKHKLLRTQLKTHVRFSR